jgi:hypothetical protein
MADVTGREGSERGMEDVGAAVNMHALSLVMV